MNKVIVRTTFRFTKNKGKTTALEVYEIEQRISQDQPALASNSCHCAHSANQDNNREKKITVALEYWIQRPGVNETGPPKFLVTVLKMKKLSIPVPHIHAGRYTFNILLKKLTFIVRRKKSTFDTSNWFIATPHCNIFPTYINVILLVFNLV